VNADLIRKGYKTYAYVKNDIIHHTGYKKITSFLQRRILFMDQFYLLKAKSRRYSLYEPQDFWKLLIFILYSVTIVKPLFDSTRGYIKIKDSAWFLHPVLCFALTAIYASMTVKNLLKKI